MRVLPTLYCIYATHYWFCLCKVQTPKPALSHPTQRAYHFRVQFPFGTCGQREREGDGACFVQRDTNPRHWTVCAVVGPAAMVSRPDDVIVHRKAERDNAAVVVECRCRCPDKGAKESQIPKSSSNYLPEHFLRLCIPCVWHKDRKKNGYIMRRRQPRQRQRRLTCAETGEMFAESIHSTRYWVRVLFGDDLRRRIHRNRNSLLDWRIYRKKPSSIQAFSRMSHRRFLWLL